jgi:hypothetical protein
MTAVIVSKVALSKVSIPLTLSRPKAESKGERSHNVPEIGQ